MKIALLSDAHGNSVGLSACLDKIAGMDVDDIYFLGDAVGYLSSPRPVLGLLRESGAHCQMGNHEAMLLGELPVDPERDRHYQLAKQRLELEASEIVELATWPRFREVEIDGHKLLLVHASPAPSIEERLHEDTAWTPPAHFAYAAAFIGHTHRAFLRREGDVSLINVGSCGFPRDRGDLAAFVIYDGATREATIHRVPFDVDRTLQLHGDGLTAEVRAIFERRGSFHGEIL